MHLSGVNSINWARIVAQVTYYFFAASRLGATNGPLSFAVPTGNFGDIFAGYVAKRMGLPIGKLIIASNENDILPRAVATGVYEMKDVVATSSPSMDIQISSNFERYLFEASGRDADLIRSLMASLDGQRPLRAWPALADAQSRFRRGLGIRSRRCRLHPGNRKTRYGYRSRSAHRLRARRRRALAVTATTQSFLQPPIPPNSPTRLRPSRANGRRLPKRLAHLMTDTNASRCCRIVLRRRRLRSLQHSRVASRAACDDDRTHHAAERPPRCDARACRHLETVSLGVWVAVGCRHERDDQHGLSIFSNTWRSKARKRARPAQIADEIESVGGDLNASTGLDTTAYYARVLKGDEDVALELIADILLNSKFSR